MREGEYAARALLQESLSLFRDVKEKHAIVRALNSLARICWLKGEDAAARAVRGEAGEEHPDRDSGHRVPAKRVEGPGAGFAAAWAEGRALSRAQAAAFALEEHPAA